MPTYISLIRYTQKGMETLKEGPKRLDAAKQRFRAAGGELKAFYLVTGQYDAVAISELPNDEAVARLVLANAAERTSPTCRPRRVIQESARGSSTWRSPSTVPARPHKA
jgi:uncharacterized protein with GYD domain